MVNPDHIPVRCKLVEGGEELVICMLARAPMYLSHQPFARFQKRIKRQVRDGHAEELVAILRADIEPARTEYLMGRTRVAHEIDQKGLEEIDRKSVVWGKSVSVRVDPVGRGLMKKKKRYN